jgi:D-alanyl-D-alanine carboxypeptidase/D-alanyl-D-alanine-endopeptidase (penicillin-binding protein 4)
MAHLLCLILALLLGTQANALEVPRDVRAQLFRAQVPLSAVSFSVKTLDPRPQTRLAFRDHEPMNPASVMKLVTTFAALDQLGPNFQWKTRFYADGPLVNGELKGNLIIRGGGDPKWVIERILADMATLRSAGVLSVSGDIVLDRGVFDLPIHSAAAFDGEPLRPYNAAPDGLLVNFKSVAYTFSPTPGDSVVRVKLEPPLADTTIDNQLRPTSGICDDWRSHLHPDFSQGGTIVLAGEYKISCGERSWTIAHPDADAFSTKVVKALFLQSGGQLSGLVRYGTTPSSARLVAEGQSLPLWQVIADINKFSNNVMAQQVFLTLGLDGEKAASFADAQKFIRSWWLKNFDPRIEAPSTENGSGLSRHERISTNALSELLQKASTHPHSAFFEGSLGLAGVDGTVKHFDQRVGLENIVGQAALKTGTLKDTLGLAGYVTSNSGTRYRLVALINHPNAPNARPAMDALLAWVMKDGR